MSNGPMFFAVLSLVLTGCSASGREEATSTELVRLTTLPPCRSLESNRDLQINVLFDLRPDGSVADVRLLGTSRDPEWDLAAADSMKRWQFTPARWDSAPSERWIRIAILVRPRESRTITVGELHADSLPEADSLCALLRTGVEFETLSREPKPGTSIPRGRITGPVDIATFPQRIREELRDLREDGFTGPIRVGSEFIIYVRLRTDRL